MGDKLKKFMPSISNYVSDDDLSDDYEVNGDDDNAKNPNLIDDFLSDGDISSASSDEGSLYRLCWNNLKDVKKVNEPVAELFERSAFKTYMKRKRCSRRESGFGLFFRETQNTIKQRNPSMSFHDINGIINKEWQTLSDNVKYSYRCRARSKENLNKHLYQQRIKVSSIKNLLPPSCHLENCDGTIKKDPRWNRNFCSEICVKKHCKSIFEKFYPNQKT